MAAGQMASLRPGGMNVLTAALPSSASVPSTVLAPTPASPPAPVGLTTADAERIGAAIAAAHPESTREVYARAWSLWDAGAWPAGSRRSRPSPSRSAPTPPNGPPPAAR